MAARIAIRIGSLVLLISLLGGCHALFSSPTSVGSVILTDQVDPHRQSPLRALTSYPKESTTLILSIEVLNPKAGTKLESRWFYDKQGDQQFRLVETAEVAFSKTGNRYVAFRLLSQTPLPSGQYKVQIHLNHLLVKEVPVRVE